MEDASTLFADEQDACGVCGAGWWDFGNELLLCDSCDAAFHLRCLDPPLSAVPQGNWHCPGCLADNTVEEPVTARGGGVGVGGGGGGGGGSGGGGSAAPQIEECGTCVACRDKVKFGGPGIRKARCVLKPKGHERRRSAPASGAVAPSAAGAVAPSSATSGIVAPDPTAPSAKRARGRPARRPDPPPEPEGGNTAVQELNSIEKVLDVRTRAPSDGERSGGGGAAIGARESGAREGRAREGGARGTDGVIEYLCKMRGLAHVHSRWLTQVRSKRHPSALSSPSLQQDNSPFSSPPPSILRTRSVRTAGCRCSVSSTSRLAPPLGRRWLGPRRGLWSSGCSL